MTRKQSSELPDRAHPAEIRQTSDGAVYSAIAVGAMDEDGIADVVWQQTSTVLTD